MVIDALREGTQPLVPVEAGGNGHPGQLAGGGGGGDGIHVVAAHIDLQLVDLAQFPFAGQVGRMDEFLAGALLGAHLQDAVVLAHGLHQLLSLIDGEGGGLLQVDILAGLAGGDGHHGVLVVGRGDDHGVDVRTGQQVLVVLIHIHLHLALSLGAVVVFYALGKAVALHIVHVAAGHHAHVIHADEALQQVHRLLSQADKAQLHFAVGSFLGRFGSGGGRCQGVQRKQAGGGAEGGCPEEISSLHNYLIFSFLTFPSFQLRSTV